MQVLVLILGGGVTKLLVKYVVLLSLKVVEAYVLSSPECNADSHVWRSLGVGAWQEM